MRNTEVVNEMFRRFSIFLKSVIHWCSGVFGYVLCIGVLFSLRVEAVEPDWHEYDELLAQYVSPGESAGVELNQVDYAGLARDPKFKNVVDMIAVFPLAQLSTADETLAFYINVYNVLALNMVVQNFPVQSIKDVGSFFRPVWKRPAGKVGGRQVTLHAVEHKILRTLNEPRIHFAIVCASVSCPDLRLESYVSDRLDMQLDDQCRRFLNNPNKGLRETTRKVEVSKIFKWFEQDFEPHGGIANFIRRYRELPGSSRIDPAIDYNWSLNGR
ncbi:MAG: hypothetical protein ACI9BW_003771 [Gammaproteobacteria bacterium]|jgi:hypothetical protein